MPTVSSRWARAMMNWTPGLRTIVAALMLLAPVSSASADEEDYSPAKIQETLDKLGWVCWVQSLCPYTADLRQTINRAILGDRSAQYRLGLTLLTGDGLPTERGSGMRWIVMAAEQGHPSAASFLAGKMRNGEPVEVDETKVADALKPQAAAGDIESMRALAPMLISGHGVKQDPAQGVAMLVHAAEHGSSDAEKDLSSLYLNGAPGVPVNRPEAMKWLGVSARHGNPDAMTSLGFMAINTPTVANNLIEGYCWLVRAAMLDVGQAQEKLSLTFSRGEKDGRGNEIALDRIEADFWLRVAARSPYYGNSQIRASIEPHMTTEQRDEAKRRFNAWHPLKLEEVRVLSIPLPGTLAGGPAARSCAPMN